jgi:hypothetical protein
MYTGCQEDCNAELEQLFIINRRIGQVFYSVFLEDPESQRAKHTAAAWKGEYQNY